MAAQELPKEMTGCMCSRSGMRLFREVGCIVRELAFWLEQVRGLQMLPSLQNTAFSDLAHSNNKQHNQEII